MKKNITFFFLIFFFNFSVFATNIRVLNLEEIIQNNLYMITLYEQINEDQKNYTKNFNFQERQLEKDLESINDLRLILENAEFEKEVNIYNKKLNDFNTIINKFNTHYEKQVNDFRNILITYILELLKKYSLDNKIDLILDANNYILSSGSIDITDIILKELNKTEIDFKLTKYE